MILGTIRRQLTRDDAQYALWLLVQGDPSEQATLEAALRDHGIDALLDDARLPEALPPTGAERRYRCSSTCSCSGRCAMRTNDRGLADFVSGIVLHFGLRDRAHRVREHDDVRYDTLADLACDSECSDPTRAFLVRAHMGHYALWLAGLFPDRIEAQHHRRGGPALDYFDEMGRRGDQMAAQHRPAAEHGGLFGVAAERFPRLRGLNRERCVLFPHYHSADSCCDRCGT
jgi:hypothetical protein